MTNFSAALAQISDPSAFGPTINLPIAGGNTDILFTITWNVIPGFSTVVIDLDFVGLYSAVRSAPTQITVLDQLRNQGTGQITTFASAATWHEGQKDDIRENGATIGLQMFAPNTGTYNGIIRIQRQNATGQLLTRSITIDPTSILGVVYPYQP